MKDWQIRALLFVIGLLIGPSISAASFPQAQQGKSIPINDFFVSPLPTPRPGEFDPAVLLPPLHLRLIANWSDSPVALSDALSALKPITSTSSSIPLQVKALPVTGSQTHGLPAIFVWWRSTHTLAGLLAWKPPTSRRWLMQFLPLFAPDSTVDAARLRKKGNTYEIAFVRNPCSTSSMWHCHQLFLYRLVDDQWQEIWSSWPLDHCDADGWCRHRLIEGWKFSHAQLQFVGSGLDTVVLESSSWVVSSSTALGVDDPKSKTFSEANVGPHRWFFDTWQRQGDAYVLVDRQNRPSAYNTLVEFLYALKTGGDAIAWSISPDLVIMARALGLATLPNEVIPGLPDWERSIQDGPISVDFNGWHILFAFAEIDGQYFIKAIQTTPDPLSQPTPTSTPAG